MFRGDGWEWSAYRVRGILRNEAYIGYYVYARTRSPLHSRPIQNDRELWIRTKILPPIVSKTLFDAAQKRLPMRRSKAKLYTDGDLLNVLRGILRKHGRVSAELIDSTPGAPSTGTFRKRFGSLTSAYRKIGAQVYKNFRDEKGFLWTEESRLQCLRDLYSRNGYVSQKLIDATPGVPASSTYFKYFKSIKAACIAAGVPIVADPNCYRGPRVAGAQDGELKPMYREVCFDGRIVWTTFSSESIISTLRQLLQRQGYLNSKTIIRTPEMPSICTINRRFGLF